jgi:YEATS family
VTIFLDESFPLPRIIELRVPPFRWVSYGWGEFNLNIRLAFCDPVKNKPMDVVHPLKLDPGRTGREILGYEGYFDVELDRNSQFLVGEPGVEYDEIPKLAEVEKAGNVNSSANKAKGREEELDADTIRVAHPRDMITIGLHPVTNGKDKRPLLPKNPSFKSDDSIAKKGSDDDDAEIRQIVDKLEPYSAQLHQAAKKHPLVSMNSGKSPYSIAPSNQVFLSWNHGRQKSVEWHRARLVEGDVLANLDDAAREVATGILTTKGIVVWCRRNQYGPPEALEVPVSGEDTTKYCRFCGMIADSPPQKGQRRPKSSYGVDAYCRCGQNMAVSLAGLKTASSVQDMITRNRAVRRPSTSSQKVVSLKPADIRALLMQTDVNLLRWVWSAIVQLNLPCAAPKVTQGDTHRSIGDALAATSLMTHSARIFINRLIDLVRRQSSAPEPEDDDEVIVVGLPSSARRDIPPSTAAPLLITPIHILSAIRSGMEFDFLTNAGMATASSQVAAGHSGES